MKMRLSGFLIWLGFIMVIRSNGQSCAPDSIIQNTVQELKKNILNGFLATTFTTNLNWKGQDNSFFLFAGMFNVTLIRNDEKINRLYELRTEINYQKFIDSSWIKNADNLFLSYIRSNNITKEFKSSYQAAIKTQITNTWEPPGMTPGKQVWKSGPMLPFEFIAGYGLNKIFWKTSYLNISLISLKIETRKRTKQSGRDQKTLAATDQMIVDSEYGINFQCSVSKEILKSILWDNKSTAFLSNIKTSLFKFDVQNSISLKLTGTLKIKAGQRFSYDHLISKKVQSKFEILLGYNIEK